MDKEIRKLYLSFLMNKKEPGEHDLDPEVIHELLNADIAPEIIYFVKKYGDDVYPISLFSKSKNIGTSYKYSLDTWDNDPIDEQEGRVILNENLKNAVIQKIKELHSLGYVHGNLSPQCIIFNKLDQKYIVRLLPYSQNGTFLYSIKELETNPELLKLLCSRWSDYPLDNNSLTIKGFMAYELSIVDRIFVEWID